MIWIKRSETSLLVSFISNSNKTLKPMQEFNGWNVEEISGTAKDEEGSMYGGWVNKMERR